MESRDGRALSDPSPRALRGRRARSLPRTARGRFAAAGVLAALLGVLLGIALHLAGPRSAPQPAGPRSAPPLTLPLFHGQGDWGPGRRRAPPFSLRDQHGRLVSLAGQLGRPVLIAFLGTAREDHSGPMAVALAQALALLGPAQRPVLDIVSLDPSADTPGRVRAAAARWGLPAPLHWLSAPAAALARTAARYGLGPRADARGATRAQAPLYLVDRAGFERAGYLYPFFPTVLARDLERLDRTRR